jgi:hypothetical protein
MPTHVIPTQRVDYVSAGYTTAGLTDPLLLLVVNGTSYSGAYIEYFGDSAWKIYFPGYISSTGEIRLYCHAVNYNSTVPSTTLSNLAY